MSARYAPDVHVDIGKDFSATVILSQSGHGIVVTSANARLLAATILYAADSADEYLIAVRARHAAAEQETHHEAQ